MKSGDFVNLKPDFEQELKKLGLPRICPHGINGIQ